MSDNFSSTPLEATTTASRAPRGSGSELAIRDMAGRRDAPEYLTETDRKYHRVEEALRESEERYQMLLDGVDDHAIFLMDPKGRIISWNSGAERIKGYAEHEIIGHNFSCFFTPEDIRGGRPEDGVSISAEN
jgi:PAS domain-containing protein